MILIRQMKEEDRKEVLKMMWVFYDSPAVLYEVAEDVPEHNIDQCIEGSPYIEGYVFIDREHDEQITGFSLVARSYPTECGGNCIWIEDLYIKPEYRGQGIGTKFLTYIEDTYGQKVVRLRLEVERENERAVATYEKCGYKELPYIQMTKEK